jgi:hypothetical protein
MFLGLSRQASLELTHLGGSGRPEEVAPERPDLHSDQEKKLYDQNRT